MYFKKKHIGGKLAATAMLLVTLGSCINEDLSDCEQEYEISYEVKLETNLQTELDANLETIEEKELGKKLKEALANVFTKKVKDFDLRFYIADSTLSHQIEYKFEQATDNFTRTIYLPAMDYQHLAMANDNEESNVDLVDADRANTVRWVQKKTANDTIDSYTHGLFAARLKMEVKDVSETFRVKMYMQNAAAAVVLDPDTVKVKSVQGVMTHLADGFALRDSIYSFHNETAIRANELKETGSRLRCVYGVGFPSRNQTYVRAASDESNEGDIWEFRIVVTLESGKVIPTVLHVKTPLKAGQLKIIKVKLNAEGEVTAVTVGVGASTDLEWSPGGEYNPEI